jgi:RHS repeat-associated protein
VYTIDSWSNLTNRSGPSGMSGCSTEGLSLSASLKNQLVGLSYDAAGNVTNDGSGNSPTYDAENRIITDAGVTYSYDADGNRMEKSSGTFYWYGGGGAVLAESDLSGNINEEYIFFNGERIARVDRPSGTVHYYFSDQLGSASVIASASGSVQEQYFYYPYGGIQSTVGSDPNHYKFNGKERDAESGLDNFGARFDSSSLGRFMTPDWAAKPTTVPYARFGDPQSLNLYSFVENSPINRIDADGHVTSADFRCPDQRHCVDQSPVAGSCDNTAGNCYTGDWSSDYILWVSQRSAQNTSQYDPKKSGPEDPTNPGHPLSQNSVVKKASDEAWQTTTNGTARNGRAEAGGTIEYKDGKIFPANKVNSVNGDPETANHLQITTDANTIAIYHTHGNSLDPRPSPGDRSPNTQVPDFVRSQRSLYVTIPGSAHGNPSLNDYTQLQ